MRNSTGSDIVPTGNHYMLGCLVVLTITPACHYFTSFSLVLNQIMFYSNRVVSLEKLLRDDLLQQYTLMFAVVMAEDILGNQFIHFPFAL